jgi:hypothetical protein
MSSEKLNSFISQLTIMTSSRMNIKSPTVIGDDGETLIFDDFKCQHFQNEKD